MLRPSEGPRLSGIRLVGALALGLAVLLAPAGRLLAFDDNDSAFDGFGADQIAERDGSGPAWQLPGRKGDIRPVRDATTLRDLYQDAMDDLKAGERQSAQRLFERLVAQAPDSPLASEARRQLANLYSSSGVESPRDAIERPAAAGARPIPPSALGMRESRSSDPAWVSPDTEMQFIVNAGDRIFFSSGSADLGARARSVLEAQARWLKSHPDFEVSIEGYADDLPLSSDQQLSLAEARAETVRQRLISQGVAPARIHVAAFGRDNRLSDCDAPECSAQNRRAITVLKPGTIRRESMEYPPALGATPVASGGMGLGAR